MVTTTPQLTETNREVRETDETASSLSDTVLDKLTALSKALSPFVDLLTLIVQAYTIRELMRK
jgi:hypothetical protein